jgi:hypothetical protein
MQNTTLAKTVISPKDKPTPEGVRRYPETHGYYRSLPAPHAAALRSYCCTCVSCCEPVCHGECDCTACSARWVDTQYPKMAQRANF